MVIFGACAGAETPPTIPELTFENLEPLSFGASGVSFAAGSGASGPASEEVRLSPTSVRDAVDRWASRRFVANGVGATRVVVSLEEGSITERALEVGSGLRGLFKDEQSVEYEVRIKVVVRAFGPDGQQRADAASEAWQTRTLGEDADTAEKQMALFEMIEATILAMDRELMPGLQTYFSDYLL